MTILNQYNSANELHHIKHFYWGLLVNNGNITDQRRRACGIKVHIKVMDFLILQRTIFHNSAKGLNFEEKHSKRTIITL